MYKQKAYEITCYHILNSFIRFFSAYPVNCKIQVLLHEVLIHDLNSEILS